MPNQSVRSPRGPMAARVRVPRVVQRHYVRVRHEWRLSLVLDPHRRPRKHEAMRARRARVREQGMEHGAPELPDADEWCFEKDAAWRREIVHAAYCVNGAPPAQGPWDE